MSGELRSISETLTLPGPVRPLTEGGPIVPAGELNTSLASFAGSCAFNTWGGGQPGRTYCPPPVSPISTMELGSTYRSSSATAASQNKYQLLRLCSKLFINYNMVSSHRSVVIQYNTMYINLSSKFMPLVFQKHNQSASGTSRILAPTNQQVWSCCVHLSSVVF